MKRFITFSVVFSFLAFNQILSGQISIAPTSLFIHDNSNVASLFVNNNSQEAQEVSIELNFSYPGSDENGNIVMLSSDKSIEEKYGLNENLRAFPRQFVLQPGAQQTVRIQIRPLQGRSDGVYWTRIIVSSMSAVKDLDSLKVAEGISTKINYVLKQNIPAYYIKGKATTGITVGEVKTSVENNRLIVISDLTASGNSPFNGRVVAKLTDEKGVEIVSHEQILVVYFNSLRRIEISLPENIKPGKYNLSFTFETKRADISPDDLVQTKTVNHTVQVDIK